MTNMQQITFDVLDRPTIKSVPQTIIALQHLTELESIFCITRECWTVNSCLDNISS